MDLLKRFIKLGQVSKDINTEVTSSDTLQENLVQTLVTVEDIDWARELSNVFSSDADVTALIKQKLNLTDTATGNAPAARRYYICNSDYSDQEKLVQRPYYGTMVDDAGSFPLLIKEKDLYLNCINKDRLPLTDNVLSKFSSGTYTDFPQANMKGLEYLSSDENSKAIYNLFKFDFDGPQEDLAPFTATTNPSWSANGSLFTIDPTRDYHFGFEFNVRATCYSEVNNKNLLKADNILDAVDTSGRRFIKLNDVTGAVEFHVFARLHNGNIDDSANTVKLKDNCPSFFLLSRQNWTILDMAATSDLRTFKVQGGFRLRSLIDDCISASFMNTGGAVSDRARFKYVDIVIGAVTNDTISNSGGQVLLTLIRETMSSNNTGKDVTNFIDVIDLGKVL